MLLWPASCFHAEFVKFSFDNDDGVCENVFITLCCFFFKVGDKVSTSFVLLESGRLPLGMAGILAVQLTLC